MLQTQTYVRGHIPAPISSRPALFTRELNDAAWTRFVEMVAELVRKYPVVKLVRRHDQLQLQPVDAGFPIYIAHDRGSIIPSFGSWYDEFDSSGIVLTLLEQALTGALRTREERSNGKLRRCAVEVHTGTVWQEIAEMRFFVWPFRPRSIDVEYRVFGA